MGHFWPQELKGMLHCNNLGRLIPKRNHHYRDENHQNLWIKSLVLFKLIQKNAFINGGGIELECASDIRQYCEFPQIP